MRIRTTWKLVTRVPAQSQSERQSCVFSQFHRNLSDFTMAKLSKNINEIKSGVVAIGFTPSPAQVTIVGSGFCVSGDGKILTAAHIWNQVPNDQRPNMKAFVMVEEAMDYLDRYKWIPVELVKKDDQSDIALLRLTEYEGTLLKPLKIGDSDSVEVGQEVYFIGFPYAAQLMNDGFGVTLVVNKSIVSTLKREGNTAEHKRSWIFVDTISNPGNSGCPLIDVETNRVIGLNTISFRMKSKVTPNLDIREPMHIAGAKPINLAKELLDG